MIIFRLPNLARWLAGIYLALSLLVYFGSLGRKGHEWWPVFLYFFIWPLSLIHRIASSAFFDWVFPATKAIPDWAYAVNDYIGGAFYILVGTVWIWFLGRIISRVLTWKFPFRENAVSSTPAHKTTTSNPDGLDW